MDQHYRSTISYVKIEKNKGRWQGRVPTWAVNMSTIPSFPVRKTSTATTQEEPQLTLNLT